MKTVEVRKLNTADIFPSMDEVSVMLDGLGEGHAIDTVNWMEFSYRPDVRFNIAGEDGKLIATGSWDGSARIWDVSTGGNVLTLHAYGKVLGVTFSQDGRRFAIKSGSGGIYIFVLPIDELVAQAKSRVTRSLTTEECQQYLHVPRCTSEQ